MQWYQQQYGWQNERNLNEPGNKWMVDHTDGDSLLNDPYCMGLRVCSASENCHNRPKVTKRKGKFTSSQYKGISSKRNAKKERIWKIDFQYKDGENNTVRVRKPMFRDEKSAVEFYNSLVRKHTNGFGRENRWLGYTKDAQTPPAAV